MSKDAWNVLINHIFINQFGESLSVVDVDATHIFFTLRNLIQEIPRHHEGNNYEKYHQHLEMIFFLLKEPW